MEEVNRDSNIKTIVDSHVDGYAAWYDLAAYIGQQMLNEYAPIPSVQKQCLNQMWIQFSCEYNSYAHELMMHREYVSECYYVYSIV